MEHSKIALVPKKECENRLKRSLEELKSFSEKNTKLVAGGRFDMGRRFLLAKFLGKPQALWSVENLRLAERRLAAPCGLYCGACIDYLVYKSCHGCGCECGKCDALEHHRQCDIYKCCVEREGFKTCSECEDFPCSLLIQFCYNPIWLHHLPVIENLRRRKTVGTEKWLKEQEEIWRNEWYLRRWLWFQKECEKRLKQSKESKDFP